VHELFLHTGSITCGNYMGNKKHDRSKEIGMSRKTQRLFDNDPVLLG
jgi:hypothetical protein